MRNYIYLITVCLLLSSCEDFLEVEPDLLVSFNEQLVTEAGLEEALRGVYITLEDRVTAEKAFIYPDVMGGNLTFPPDEDATPEVNIDNAFTNTYEFNDMAMSSEFESVYENYYDVINVVNVLLERLDSFNFISDTRRSQLEAELLTIRAYTHYMISLKFAQHHGFTADGSHLGIVYNTTPIEVAVDFPSRDTVQENYLSIQDDLERAISLFQGEPFLTSRNPIGYFNTINTRALYARIALQMEDWQQALDLSTFVINNAGVSLTPSSNYVNQWQDIERIDETLLSFNAPLSSDNGGVSSSIFSFYFFENENVYGDYSISRDLIDLYEPTDIRASLYEVHSVETLTNGDLSPQDYYFTNKYGAVTVNGVREASARINIRLSEMYLIAAEAQERLTPGSSSSLTYLNDIRTRAGLAPIMSTNNLLEELFLERRRELALEGFLLYDIARFKRNIERNDGCIASVCDLNYPSDFFILPIPFESVQLNENMIQNEGY